MKKLISSLAALAVVSACSFGALAADITVDYENPEVTPGTITATEAETLQNHTWDTADAEKTYTFTVSDSSYQNTILAFDGTDTIKVGTIQYIDQGTADFTFALRNAASTAEKITVLMGGKDAPVIAGYIEKEQSSTPETFTISGTVSGYAGATLPTVVVSDGTNNYPATVLADKTFTVVVPVLESGSYTLTATKTAHLKYTKTNITAETTVNPVIKAGNMNGDNIADVSDMALIVDNYGAMSGATGYTEAYDANEDDIMDVSDMALVVDNYGEMDISE